MLYLVLFVALIILLLWLFQIVFLDDFYRRYKAGQVARVADAVVSSLEDSDLSGISERLAAQNDTCILLLDADGQQLLSAEGTRNCLIHRMDAAGLSYWRSLAPADGSALERLFHITPSQYVLGGILPDELSGAPSGEPAAFQGEEGTPPPMPEGTQPALDGLSSPPPSPTGGKGGRERFDKSDRSAYRNFWNLDDSDVMSLLYVRQVQLSDGTTGTLLLNAQITPVSATVSALRSQLLIITLIILVAALLLAWLISRRISTPLIETNTAAKALSQAQYQKPRHGDSYREIAELNATLEKAAQELGQVDELQHELIANISHDLRTPLTMIGGYAEAMRDIPDENNPENMQIIIDETARLSTLVNELLDFSRMQTGQTEMHPAPYAFTQSVQAIVGRIGSMVAKDGYTVRFAPEADCWALADEQRIGQVVYNLIGNALTYTGEDKVVTVTQRLVENRVRLEVRDTGKGIAPEELSLIWNRYYRTKETHRRAIIGSGLGLNIVQSILEKHHAPYGVESQVGEGTTFWFELPVAAM